MVGLIKKNNYSFHKSSISIVSSLLLAVTFISNRSYAQAVVPAAYVNIVGPTVICETSTGIIDFIASSGTAPFKFVYNITSVAGVVLDSVSTLGAKTDTAITHILGAGTFTYSLLNVTDVNYNHVPQISSQVLEVQALPTASAGGTYTTTICSDGGVATVVGTANNGTINWTVGNGHGVLTNQNSPTPTYTASLDDAGKTVALIMTVTANGICSSQPPAMDKYYVPVRQAMIPSFSISSPSACLNSTDARVTFSAANGTPPYTFTYSVNGDYIPITTVGTNTTAVLGGITSVVSPPANVYDLISVQDANCSQSVVSSPRSFTVNPIPQASMINNPRACQYDPVSTVNIIGWGGTSPYTVTFIKPDGRDTAISLNQSQNSSVDSLHYPNSSSVSGIFTYSLTSIHDNSFGTNDSSGNYQGCYGTLNTKIATVTIDPRPYARFSVSPERVSNLDAEVTVSDYSIAATNWLWNFGDSTISPFKVPGSHVYKDTGTYTITLKVSTGVACSDITSQNVRVYLPFTLYVPNAFSPNNDGVNDVFLPKADGLVLSEYNMTIYDRWGSKLFYSTDINKGWNGTVNGGSEIVPIDCYVYVINIVADEDYKTYIFHGSVTSTLR